MSWTCCCCCSSADRLHSLPTCLSIVYCCCCWYTACLVSLYIISSACRVARPDDWLEIVENDMGAAAVVAAAQVIHIGQMVVIIIILSHATATTTTDPTTSSNVMFQHKFTSRGGHPSKWSSSSWMCSLSRRWRRTISRLGFTQRICPFVRPSVICPESDSTLPDIFQHNNWWSKRAIERLPGLPSTIVPPLDGISSDLGTTYIQQTSIKHNKSVVHGCHHVLPVFGVCLL